jgi:hypothetical protein
MMQKYCSHCNTAEFSTGMQCYRCNAKFKIHRDNFFPESHTIQPHSADTLRYFKVRVTNKQKESLFNLYERGKHWRFMSYAKFRRRFSKDRWGTIGGYLPNQNLFVGIEPDGYTHT